MTVKELKCSKFENYQDELDLLKNTGIIKQTNTKYVLLLAKYRC